MKPLIIGNWKMNLSLQEAVSLARSVRQRLVLNRSGNKAEVVLCPSFEALVSVKKVLGRGQIELGGQDVFWQAYGPFTGEVTAQNLADLGCRYVIVGHSERRQHLAETNEMINRKVKAVLEAGMIPILCVGETIEERREQQQDLTVMTQIIEGLAGIQLTADQSLVIAYEPVWVIGSGQAINPPEAGRMSWVARQALIDIFPLTTVQQQTRIIYGGSVDDVNIKSFHDLELISGFLVGGSSLDSHKFIDLIKAL
ncbi:MAG: triose-phosphate isomerase [Candidatus Komeilibacteria bacterium]